MALVVQSTDITGAGPVISLGAINDLFVSTGTLIVATSGTAITGTGTNTATINGEVFATSHAIDFTGNSSQITIGSTGTVTGAIQSGANPAVIFTRGDNSAVFNHGTVSGGSALTGLEGTDILLVNSGHVTGTNAFAFQALNEFLAGTGTITNTGFAYGTASGYQAFILDPDDTVNLTNSGYLGGGSQSYKGGSSTDNVRNTGTMEGDVFLGSGADSFDGRGGTVIGTLFGEDGNDIFFVDGIGVAIDGGIGNDTVFAGTDLFDLTGVEEIRLRGAGDFTIVADSTANTIIGNVGDNDLSGGGNEDTINGFGGDDILSGGSGNDTILGGTGNDLLDGSLDDDRLLGQSGNDEILGGDGADNIFGGIGNDTITGGAGRDLLRGEGGADTFIYESTADSGLGAAADVIFAFQRGSDVIDVSGIGDPFFTFIGTSAFTAGGDMELRYRTTVSGNSIVEMDENGDGIADSSIVVRGLLSLDAADFIL